MILNYLKPGKAPADKNMAEDLLLLEAYPEADTIRLRSYGWDTPAWTFGYSQKFETVWQDIPETAEHVYRRPTGGGLVDHTQDWTYSLVIPPEHSLYKDRATTTYAFIHQALAQALRSCSITASLQDCTSCDQEAIAPACFTRAEPFDVILTRSGQKIAGAALKRNHHGLLLQGSIDSKVIAPLSREAFFEAFIPILAQELKAKVFQAPLPEYPDELRASYEERLRSRAWNERR